MTMIIALLIGAAIGVGIGYLIRQSLVAKKVGGAEARAEKILEEAKVRERELLLEAKTRSLEIIDQAKKQESEFRGQIVRFEERIDRKEKELDNKTVLLDKQKADLEAKGQEIKSIQEEIHALRAKQLENLEKIAGMTREQASKVLLDNAEKTVKAEMLELYQKLLAQTHEDAEREGRNIVAQAIERVASEVTAEVTTTTVSIPNEEMKGRIIGKEGRNIRAFEQMMGVEILIDDSPDTVVISGFNSIRRHIAKLTLEKLVADGESIRPELKKLTKKAKRKLTIKLRKPASRRFTNWVLPVFRPSWCI